MDELSQTKNNHETIYKEVTLNTQNQIIKQINLFNDNKTNVIKKRMNLFHKQRKSYGRKLYNKIINV